MSIEEINANEPSQLRLTYKSRSILKSMKEDGHIEDMRDGFCLGLALALNMGGQPPELPAENQNYISVSSLDPDGSIASAIKLLVNLNGYSVYRYAERLADKGINELYERFGEGELDVASLFSNQD